MKERLILDVDREFTYVIIMDSVERPGKYDYDHYLFVMGLYETLTITAPRWVFKNER